MRHNESFGLLYESGQGNDRRMELTGGENRRARRGAPLWLVLPLFLILLLLYSVGAVAVNRLYRQTDRIEQLETALMQTRQEIAAVSGEAESLRNSLEEAGRREAVSLSAGDGAIVRSVAHRGLSDFAPENTLPAFALARQSGFSHVETDLRFTADGYAVCIHDDTIDRTSNGSGVVAQMTLEELRQYDFGAWKAPEYAGTKIPTFEEFLTLCRSLGLRPYLELKSNGGMTDERVAFLLETVRAYGMEDEVTWISFSYPLLSFIRGYSPSSRLGYLVTSVNYNTVAEARWLLSGENSVFLNSSSYSNDECRLCFDNGLPLEVWTLDTPEEVLALNPYVSGVTSNCLLAGRVLAEAWLARNGYAGS